MKNDYQIRGELTAILINSPKYGLIETIISTRNLDRAREFPNAWCLKYARKTNSFYVFGNLTVEFRKRKVKLLHRWLTESPSGTKVDHFNHNTLDNTDRNLRIVTNAENMQNRKGAASNSASGVRGVYWHKRAKKWCAELRIDGKKINVGYFDDLSHAEKMIVVARKNLMPYAVS